MNVRKKALSGSVVIKGKTIKLWQIIVALVFVSGTVLAGSILMTKQASQRYSAVYKDAQQALSEGNYKKVDNLLDSVKKNKEAKESYQYYTLRAQASYGLNDKEDAKKFAETGIDLYKKSNSKESSFGIILNDIYTDTYINNDVNIDKYEVPKDQTEQSGFQG